MSFDKNKPAGSQKLRLADNDIRANNDALESALSEGHEFATGGDQTGKHTTPTFKDNGGDAAQPTGTNEVRLYNNGGLLYFLNQAGTKRDMGSIPAGTKMLFKQNSAPAGWSFVSEDNDRVLLNTSTESEGGNTGGGWTISGLSVDGHALTEAELPSISGNFEIRRLKMTTYSLLTGSSGKMSINYQGGGSTNDIAGATVGDPGYNADVVSMSFGGDASHNHGLTADGNWRPSYAKIITCQKD